MVVVFPQGSTSTLFHNYILEVQFSTNHAVNVKPISDLIGLDERALRI